MTFILLHGSVHVSADAVLSCARSAAAHESSVYVLGRDIAVLEPVGDFRSVLSYHAVTAPDDFVSPTMPVRTESWSWDDTLPPVLQMNLPEGYLLQVLQEQDPRRCGPCSSTWLGLRLVRAGIS